MFIKTFIAIACTGFFIATSAQAQEFPSKNVTLMMPYAAGGPGDTLTRIIGQGMGKVLGRQFLVENVAGAGGIACPALPIWSEVDSLIVARVTTSSRPPVTNFQLTRREIAQGMAIRTP